MPKNKRVIVDTNLWISFLLTKNLSALDILFQNTQITLLFSKELLDEFVEVSNRSKFKKYFSSEDLQALISSIKKHAEFILVSSEVNECRDPKDNFLLSLAKDGKANHLISGDKDLLELKKFGKTNILTYTEFIKA
ncbi:MAG: putative toxin-antitoxin system toxin component, PIN family [Ferruginibacter sp.]